MELKFKDTNNQVHVIDEDFVHLLPQGCTQITDEDAAILTAPPTISLQQAKDEANTAIDTQAGVTRRKYITDVAGQAETYLSKASDANAYKTAGYPSASIADYPMVQAEAKAIYGDAPTSIEYQNAADGIIATQLQWLQLAAAIEQQRRTGKIAVDNALTNEDVYAAQLSAITILQSL